MAGDPETAELARTFLAGGPRAPGALLALRPRLEAARVASSSPGKAEIERDVQRVLDRTESAEYESGFKYGQEASREEWAAYGRRAVRETLEQLAAHARGGGGDFVRGQVAGHEDTLAKIDRESARGATQRGYVSFAPLAERPTEVQVDTSVYRGHHGAEPRGRADWTFVLGKIRYELSGDPALYRPADARGVASLPYGKAKEYAIAEAKRRGVAIVGVAP